MTESKILVLIEHSKTRLLLNFEGNRRRTTRERADPVPQLYNCSKQPVIVSSQWDRTLDDAINCSKQSVIVSKVNGIEPLLMQLTAVSSLLLLRTDPQTCRSGAFRGRCGSLVDFLTAEGAVLTLKPAGRVLFEVAVAGRFY